jgi:hypothetical protein
MARWIGALLYASSLIALAVTAGHIHALIDAFPISHLSSYGPRVPAVAALQAHWLRTPLRFWARQCRCRCWLRSCCGDHGWAWRSGRSHWLRWPY